MAKAKSRPKRKRRQAHRKKNSSVLQAQIRLQKALARLDKAKLALKNAERRAKGLKKLAAKKPKLVKTQKHQTRDIGNALDFLKSLVSESKRKIRYSKKSLAKSTSTTSKRKAKARQPKITGAKIEPRILVQRLKSGEIKTIAFDVPYRNLEQWLHDLETNPTLDGQIPEGARLGFRFFGNNSLQTYASVKDALLRIGAYESTLSAIYDRPEDQGEVYRNVEFVIIESAAVPSWHYQREQAMLQFEEAKSKRRYRTSAYRKTYWYRTKTRNPAKYNAMLAKKREKARARYQRLKNDPTFKAKNRAAVRKYYRKNKGA